MIQIVKVVFHSNGEFDAVVEVEHAIESHLQQITKKAMLLECWRVENVDMVAMEKAAQADIVASMDNLTEALNRHRIEGKFT